MVVTREMDPNRKRLFMTFYSEFDVEMVVPLSTDGRSQFAPEGLPLTMKQAEEYNDRAFVNATAQLSLQAAVSWLMAREAERQNRIKRRPKPSTQSSKGLMLTKREVAERFGVSTRKIERLVEAGSLRMYRIGQNGKCRFKPEDVDRALVVEKTEGQIDDDLQDFITKIAGG
jgi:excisionase family DNA binding protein